MTITGSKFEKRYYGIYTVNMHEARSVARLHVEMARRLLKPDSVYGKSSDVVMESMQDAVECIAKKQSEGGTFHWFTVSIRSVLGTVTIDHTVEMQGQFETTLSDPI